MLSSDFHFITGHLYHSVALSKISYYLYLRMKREVWVSILWGCVATAIVAIAIFVGSRTLSHFDATLVGYTFALLFATFGIVYRYAMWLQRPPTRVYWKRGWRSYFILLARNVFVWRHAVHSNYFHDFLSLDIFSK